MPDSTTAENKYEWLITFLIYDHAWIDQSNADQDGYISLETQKNRIYAAVLKLDFHEKIKVVFLEAKINYEHTTLEIWIRSKSGKVIDLPSRQVGSINVMTTTDSLVQMLQPIVKEHSANRNIIVTLGHGSIFGINFYNPKILTENLRKNFIPLFYQKVKTPVTETIKAKFDMDAAIAASWEPVLLNEIKIKRPIQKLYSAAVGTLQDEPNLSILTVQEINDALYKIFNPKKVDILVFDNCFMQNVFTQYELRKTIDYLVAAQSGISYPGFNYTAILEMLTNNINISTAEIAKAFTSRNIVEAHEMYNEYKADIEGRWCVSTIPVLEENYELIKTNFDELCTLLVKLAEKDNDLRREIGTVFGISIKNVFNYTFHAGLKIKVFDLHCFLLYAKGKFTEGTIFAAHLASLLAPINALIEIFSSSATNRFIGKNFYNSTRRFFDEKHPEKIGYGFLMLFKPSGIKLIDIVYEMQGHTSFTPAFFVQSDYFGLIKSIRNKV